MYKQNYRTTNRSCNTQHWCFGIIEKWFWGYQNRARLLLGVHSEDLNATCILNGCCARISATSNCRIRVHQIGVL